MTPPRPPRSKAVGTVLCALGIALVALGAHFFGLILCPLKRFAGIPCPSCGTTRACLALSNDSSAETIG